MWNKIKTKVMNFFGFWTMDQIRDQYRTEITVHTDGSRTPEQINDAVQEALSGQTARRKRVAGDYFDGNDNWKNRLIATGDDFYDYDYYETAHRSRRGPDTDWQVVGYADGVEFQPIAEPPQAVTDGQTNRLPNEDSGVISRW